MVSPQWTGSNFNQFKCKQPLVAGATPSAAKGEAEANTGFLLALLDLLG